MANHPDVYLKEVLDHGLVRLIDFMGGDISVSRAARVSYNEEWKAGDDARSDEKLINYLWRNRHTTPFESVSFTFEVKAPIFVFRQWHRHRTFSYNELSARYRELPKEYYIPALEQITPQSKNNKQGREDEGFDEVEKKTVQEMLKVNSARAFDIYHQLLKMGVAKELARAALPVNTYSHMFCTVNLLNLLKFFSLRSDPHAQYEIRVYSDAMKELIRPIVPVCLAAFETTNQSNR